MRALARVEIMEFTVIVVPADKRFENNYDKNRF